MSAADASRDSENARRLRPVDTTSFMALMTASYGIGQIARLSGIDLPTVIERIAAMLRAGTIRRVRQTLMATNLAKGALIAWVVPEEKLSAAFDWMFQSDPFSGHVVIRSTDQQIAGAKYRLWTTLKVPSGFSMTHGIWRWRSLIPTSTILSIGITHTHASGFSVSNIRSRLS